MDLSRWLKTEDVKIMKKNYVRIEEVYVILWPTICNSCQEYLSTSWNYKVDVAQLENS